MESSEQQRKPPQFKAEVIANPFKINSLVPLVKYSLPVLILFAFAFRSTLIWMYGRYMSADSYYSHGFLIPFVSVFFIWQKREALAEIETYPSRLGLVLLLCAVLMHAAGTILYIFSVSGFSIFLFILGIILFIFGKKVTRTIIFPLVLLLSMFPLPEAIIGTLSFPMKMLVARAGVDIVSAIGIPVLREGFHIEIAQGSLLVGNPCSGLRSLIAFMTLGAVYAHISRFSVSRKWILFLLSIPIAVLSNIVRVPMLILTAHYYGIAAASPDSVWHDASGLMVFVIGFALLFLAGRALEWQPNVHTS